MTTPATVTRPTLLERMLRNRYEAQALLDRYALILPPHIKATIAEAIELNQLAAELLTIQRQEG